MGVTYCECNSIHDDGFPTLEIQLGSGEEKTWFKLKGRDYLMLHEHGGYYDHDKF